MRYLIQRLGTLFYQTSCLKKSIKHRVFKTIKSFTSFTHYSLIILVLLTMSCTDKKQIAEPIIAEVPKPEPIKLSYDKGLDLMLVDTQFKMWDEEISALRKDPTVFDDSGEVNGLYEATYWDTNTHTYYIVINDHYRFNRITNVQFEYTIDEQKQYEAVFHPTMKEIFRDTKAPLLYIGSISPLERVYLDPTNQNYYIKHLAPFDTSRNIKDRFNVDIEDTDTDILRVFPTADPYNGSESIHTNMPSIYYTNNNGNRFDNFIKR